MELIILAIGLVLGALCCAVWMKVHAIANEAEDARRDAREATGGQRDCWQEYTKQRERIDAHNHEITALYEKLHMRRD